MHTVEKLSLQGKTALVTGAAKRIGAEICKTLHLDGASVAIHYRQSADEAIDLASRLNEIRPDSAATFGANLINAENCSALIDEVLSWSGRLDLLVNNASTFYPTPLGEITDASWDDLMGTNLKAPLFLAQAAAPALRTEQGNIVNIVDIHAQRPLSNHHIYCAAKAGLEMLTRSLAKDLAPDVRVNGVAPGAIAWPENGLSDETKKNILAQIPLDKTGHPTDIANAVLFLIRDADFVTGQIVAIDGGRSIGW